MTETKSPRRTENQKSTGKLFPEEGPEVDMQLIEVEVKEVDTAAKSIAATETITEQEMVREEGRGGKKTTGPEKRDCWMRYSAIISTIGRLDHPASTEQVS